MKKEVTIYKNRSITKAQKTLYDLICQKLKKDEPISFDEAKEIYIDKACRDVVKGVPYHCTWKYNDKTKDTEWKCLPMSEKVLLQRVFLWLTSNIGALVLKGYLKVVPQIQLTNQ